MNFFPRKIASKIAEAHKHLPVVVVTGPRQSGKTSLCIQLFSDYRYVNLEDISTRVAALSDPTAFLNSLGDQAIIDEVQNVPELLSQIQVRVDENSDRNYILTGSSNFALMDAVSQSLAGRCAVFTLLPFALTEVQTWSADRSIDDIMIQGLYPRVVADAVPASLFYRNYYNTYVERDLRNLLKVKNMMAFDSFMRLLASRVGSEFNASSLSREVGVSSVTISEWMSILTTSYIAFPLRPYYANMSKQLTKMPKIYFYDTGLLCFLLHIETADQLEHSPLRGAIFENLAICELFKSRYNEDKEPSLYFYREKLGREVDAMLIDGTDIRLYEIKVGATFKENFVVNMKDVASQLPNVASTTVLYTGESIPPIAVNIKEI